MARTLIGELLLRLKDDASKQAADSARKIERSIQDIEGAAKKLNSAPWGGNFERQLQKIGLAHNDIDLVRTSWDKLYSSMSERNLTKAMRSSEVANWKAATLGHFASIQQGMRRELETTERRTRAWNTRMRDLLKVGMVAVGGYTGAYLGGQAITGGLTASSEWEREKFRQSMGNIPDAEKQQIIARSEQLGGKYPSVSITDIAELARNAKAMMGSTQDGLAILEDMVKGQVTLQSAQGVQVGPETMRNLLRGIDNLGQNSGGPQGIANTQEIIAGMIRAAQIEGADFDPGKLFEFARRAKVAGPGFSTDFLATTVPAIVQDMTASGAGTSFGSAFQAFVMGSNAVTNKENIANQMELGIRTPDGLVGAKQFSQDPYAWAQSVLRPALVKAGVDMTDDSAIQEKIGGLTRNQMASYALIRMITQSAQIDRNRESYRRAMGPEAAADASFKDPFVGYQGFVTSLQNLAAAVGEDVMPTITAGLNKLAGGINALQQSWRDGDPLTKAGLAGGTALAGLGTWKVVSGLWAITTAGPALNAAAISLEAAAVSLGTAGVLNGGGNVKIPKNPLLNVPSVGGLLTGVAGIGTVYDILQRGKTWMNSPEYQNSPHAQEQKARGDRNLRWLRGEGKPSGSYVGSESQLEGQRRASSGGNPLQDAVDGASRAGGQIQKSLSIQATPEVNTSSIDAAIAKAQQLLTVLKQAGAAMSAAAANVPQTAATQASRAMNRNMTDQGVVP